jgi:hypothetical protein
MFYCGIPGHVAANCKKPKKARKASGGNTTGYESTVSTASGSAHLKGKNVRTSWGATVKELEALLAAARLKEREGPILEESEESDFQ